MKYVYEHKALEVQVVKTHDSEKLMTFVAWPVSRQKPRVNSLSAPFHRGVPETTAWKSWFMAQVLNTWQHRYDKLTVA
jgi:hypothetical protein